MRNLMMALVVVGLLAAPSLGVVHVRISPAKTVIDIDEQTLVTIEVQTGETGVGVYSVGGDIIPTVVVGEAPVLGNVGELAYDAAYAAAPPSFPSAVATPANGGMSGFGSVRTTGLIIDDHGDTWVPFATYTVVGVNEGTVQLDFVSKEYAGHVTLDINYGEMGEATGASITVVPEPATMALLALGGLAIIRRRR